MVYAPRSAEFLANSVTAGSQNNARVVTLADGRVLIVWGTVGEQGEPVPIKGRFFDADGDRIGDEMFLTEVGSIFRPNGPAAVGLPDGGFMLAWSTQTGTEIFVKAQRFDASGSEIGSELAIASGAHSPEIALLDNGSIVLVWTNTTSFGGSGDGEGWGVAGTILAPDGTRQDFTVNTTTLGNQWQPSVTVLESGNFAVAWTDESGLGGDSDTSAKAQIFTPSGVKSGGEFLVNTSTASTQAEPTLAALPSGGFVAVWTHNNPGDDPFGFDIRGQIFDPNGVKVAPEFPVNASTQGNQYRATVTATANGGFLASWTVETSFNPDTPEGIAAQEFAADGTMIGPELLINNVTFNLQVGPEVALLGNGDLFFTWEDYSSIGGDASGTAIKARLFTAATPATERDDTISGTAGDDRWIALGGNDVLLMQQGGNDEADGGAGNDLFYYGGAFTASDTADGAGGRDTLILQGRYADLRLTAESLSDVETIALWSAGDNRYGGAGGPPARYVITSADGNVASGRFLTVDARQLLSGEQAIFDGSAETDGSFYFHGGAGNDNFTGGLGRDTIDGGAGNDTLAGGMNDDIYFVDHPADVVLEAVGGGGFDAVYTRVNYVLRAGQEIEQLAATGLGLGQAIALTGNEFSQSLISGSGNDDLNGGGGADFLTANAGNDRLNGGTGIDVMTGGAGNDVYFVDNIDDVVVELAGEGSDAVYASATYQLSGGAEVELLATTGLAPGQAITLFGNGFAQSIIGATGDDTLFGFGGNDSLVGNDGNDTLDGGAGNDGLRGGAGADVFQFTSVSDSTGAGDNIFDFVSGTDKIDLSLIDANVNAEGNHAFTFIGTNAFSGTAGELRLESSGGLVNVLGDVDGDGVADLIIHLYNTGGVTPLASDFVL